MDPTRFAPASIVLVAIAVVAGAAAFAAQPLAGVAVERQGPDAELMAANQLLKDRRLDDAKAAFESSLDAATQSGNVRLEARSLVGLSNVFIAQALYPQARDYGLRGLERAELAGSASDIGRANLVLSAAAEFLGDAAQAKTRAEQALSAFESAGESLGRAQATLRLLRFESKVTPDTRRLTDRVIADARTAGDASVEGSAYHLLGDRYFAAGDYAEALSALEKAAALYAASHDDTNLGTVYNSVGRVYRAHGQLQTALEFQLKALALHEGASDSFFKLQSLNAVSAVYLMLGEHLTARSFVERALTIAERTGSPRVQDFLRANLANILSALGEYGRAAELFEGVIARGLDPYITGRYSQLSYPLRKLGRHEAAMSAADTAVTRCLANEIQADIDCPWAFEARAQAYLAKGDTTNALRDITTVLDRVEVARTKLVPSDFLKLEFVRSREAAYSLAIRLLLQQGRAEEALETAELARSRAFIDLLASRDVTIRAPDPASQLALTMRGDAPSFAPRDLSSLAIAPPARAADLVATARRLKSTLVAYWTTGDAVFIWVVAPDGRIRTERVDVLASKLMALTRATLPFGDTAAGAAKLVTRGGEQFPLDPPRADAWRELYDLLIRPVRSALPTAPGSLLTIVPHGALAGLPFAALRDQRGRYLLEDFTLHYAPAGAVLQLTAGRRKPDGRSGAALIVADPIVPKQAQLGRPLPALPGARQEASAIARQIPTGRRTVLIGADATEERVAAAAEQKGVIHFATHAVVRDDAPFESFLALAADPRGDGLMTAQEIYRLNLNADLVVLTACRSGSGRIIGDGIAAFARAFIYAGTPSIVASLWDVPDVVTGTLVANFYRGWWAGASKARGLRSAQLQMLRDLRLGRITQTTAAGPVVLPEHPIFWAGLALIGEPD